MRMKVGCGVLVREELHDGQFIAGVRVENPCI